jgi:hypothetical protein
MYSLANGVVKQSASYKLIVFVKSRNDHDTSVDIVTRYELDGPGIGIPVGGEFSAPVQTGPVGHLASCVMCTGSVSWGQSGRDVALPTSPHLALRVKKE